jgi:hypothetical protein
MNEYNPEDVLSSHPVLTALKKKIEDLTNENAKLSSRAYELNSNFRNYKYKLENVLRSYAEDDESQAPVCVMIAGDMDIELVQSKDFDINVTFSVTVTAPFGEEIDISEYDVSALLEDIESVDYELNDTNVIYVTEA